MNRELTCAGLWAAAALCACSSPASLTDGAVSLPTPDCSPAATAPRVRDAVLHEIEFSGYRWMVKTSTDPVGPGPNYFSRENVSVDRRGRLHLRITGSADGNVTRWKCAEVVSQRSFHHGTYVFEVQSVLDHLDPRVVLGMFTWDDQNPAYHHRELDIEIGRWGRPDDQLGQFVIQPYTRPQNIVRFDVPSSLETTTHRFTWSPDRVQFRSSRGVLDAAAREANRIAEHTFLRTIPAGSENARINLWLFGGRPPRDGKEVEIVISRFQFIPLDEPSRR